ncbi:MAG: enoyl-CoA hydratase/isomerase family protein [Candidatus Jordarchaeum sp.]|uniref:enoyl-CoA hydratase/isomerase family protein n=1 Tax=Candidatus Jordarchaeum sp. TaxID=2823881 RepID=UPI00404ADE0A
MSSDVVLFKKYDGIGKIILNRPETLNALNIEIFEKLRNYFNLVRDDDEVKVLVITGTGRAFSAGLDFALLGSSLMENISKLRSFLRTLQETINIPGSMEKPSIAAVNGIALGGGTELALACDIRIASENAVFGIPEVCYGIIPDLGGAQRLPRVIGLGRAKELILTGDPIDAQEAWRIGLVNKVVPQNELENAVKIMADKIMDNGPVAVAMGKMVADKSFDIDLKTLLDYTVLAQDVCVRTQDLVSLYMKKLDKIKR